MIAPFHPPFPTWATGRGQSHSGRTPGTDHLAPGAGLWEEARVCRRHADTAFSLASLWFILLDSYIHTPSLKAVPYAGNKMAGNCAFKKKQANASHSPWPNPPLNRTREASLGLISRGTLQSAPGREQPPPPPPVSVFTRLMSFLYQSAQQG